MKIAGGSKEVYCIAVSKDGKLVASGSADWWVFSFLFNVDLLVLFYQFYHFYVNYVVPFIHSFDCFCLARPLFP